MGFAIGNVFAGPPPARILGIDPGLRCTGYAVIERTSGGPYLCEGGVIRSTKGESLGKRVQEIGEGVADVIEQYLPGVVTIEQVFTHGRNPKTAILMAHARGAILFAAMSRGVKVVHYSPRQIKKLLTGTGNASKTQVQSAVQREFDLPAPPEPNDVADACASALCHFHSLRLSVRSA
jgi:crossover junction endodeoxyribonuclease RuvC